MIYKWESDEERLKRFMKIPLKKKMEWLRQMQEFTLKYTTKRGLKLWHKLREMR